MKQKPTNVADKAFTIAWKIAEERQDAIFQATHDTGKAIKAFWDIFGAEYDKVLREFLQLP